MSVLIPTVACLIALGSLGGGLAVGGLTAIALYRLDSRVDRLEQAEEPLPRRTIEGGRERWADLVNPVSRPLTDEDAAWLARLQRDLREL
jgi:hypothetical protein